MPSINPGPAITSTSNTEAVLTNLNIPNFGNIPQGSNALRLLAVGRSIGILSTGDIAVLPLINSQSFILSAIYFTNALLFNAATGTFSSASAAACTVSVNGGPAVSGTSLVASAALTLLTGSNKYVSSTLAEAANTSVQTATMGTGGGASNYIYLNCSVISAAASQLDLFIYGYDIT